MLWSSNDPKKNIPNTQIRRTQHHVSNLSILSQYTYPLIWKKLEFSTTTRDSGRHEISHPLSNRNENGNKTSSRSFSHDTNDSPARTRGKVVAHNLNSVFQKYGATFVGSYFTLYILTLSGIFTGLDSGYIDPATLSDIQFNFPWHSGTGAEEVAEAEADAREFRSSLEYVVGCMRKFEWTKPYAEVVEINPRLGNLAIAWVATKFTEPIRLPVTVMLVPRIAKFLGQKTHVDDEDGKEEDRGGGSAERQK